MDKNYEILMKYLKYAKDKAINNKLHFIEAIKDALKMTNTIVQIKEHREYYEMFFTIFKLPLENYVLPKESNFLILKRIENLLIDIDIKYNHIHKINSFYFPSRDSTMAIEKCCIVKPFDFKDLNFLQTLYHFSKNEEIKNYINILVKKSKLTLQ